MTCTPERSKHVSRAINRTPTRSFGKQVPQQIGVSQRSAWGAIPELANKQTTHCLAFIILLALSCCHRVLSRARCQRFTTWSGQHITAPPPRLSARSSTSISTSCFIHILIHRYPNCSEAPPPTHTMLDPKPLLPLYPRVFLFPALAMKAPRSQNCSSSAKLKVTYGAASTSALSRRY
eukprot:2929981-Rhodomonas_salina.2